MKKLLLYIAILSLLFALTGCGEDTAKATDTTAAAGTGEPTSQTESALPEATTPPETTPTETEPQITVKQQPMTAVSLPVQIEKTKADDGTVVFVHAGQSMVLTVEDPDVADRIILDFLNRSDAHSGTQQLLDTALQMHDSGSQGLPLYEQRIYAPKRIDRSILSLYGYESAYEGAAHGTTSFKSVTYDLVTGNVLTLSDILSDGVQMDTLCAHTTTALADRSDTLFPDYQTLVADLFQKSAAEYTDWYLSTEGLCFFFSPYEIASYAAGDIVATIPYSELTGILQDAYFPPEQDISTGSLLQADFDTADIESFTQIAEVTLSPSGKKLVLHTDFSIHNIQITYEMESLSNPNYTETITVFAAAALTPGDAVIVQLPESGIASVSYTSNGQTQTETLS